MRIHTRPTFAKLTMFHILRVVQGRNTMAEALSSNWAKIGETLIDPMKTSDERMKLVTELKNGIEIVHTSGILL